MDENTIHSLLIDLELPDNGQPDVTSCANEIYEKAIFPTIDRTICQLDETNDLIIDDKIVIDLGEVEVTEIPFKLEELLTQELRRRMQLQETHPLPLGEKPSPANANEPRQQGSYPSSEAAATLSTNTIHPREQGTYPSAEGATFSANNTASKRQGTNPTQEGTFPATRETILPQLIRFLRDEEIPWQYDIEVFDATSYLSDAIRAVTEDDEAFFRLLDTAKNDKRALWRLLSMASPSTLIRLHDAILPLGTTLTERTRHDGETSKREGKKTAQEESLHGGDSPSNEMALRHSTHQLIHTLLTQLATLMEHYGIGPSESLNTLFVRIRKELAKGTGPSIKEQGKETERDAKDTDSHHADKKSMVESPTFTSHSTFLAQLSALMKRYSIGPSESLNTLLERIRGEYATQIISSFGEGKTKTETAGEPFERGMGGDTIQDILLEIERQSIEESQASSLSRRIHVNDAGIILLHPFLTAYFSQLGLIDKEKRFKSVEDQKRAVHLLKYLSGDEATHYSHRLVLEKIMCGFPPDFPMEHEFQITEEERQESEAMIASLCQYWRPLNGTSMKGLQHSFLLRHGTIERSDDAWIIRVEGSAIDILLENLPWEISTILLPWMEPMILVEWQQN